MFTAPVHLDVGVWYIGWLFIIYSLLPPHPGPPYLHTGLYLPAPLMLGLATWPALLNGMVADMTEAKTGKLLVQSGWPFLCFCHEKKMPWPALWLNEDDNKHGQQISIQSVDWDQGQLNQAWTRQTPCMSEKKQLFFKLPTLGVVCYVTFAAVGNRHKQNCWLSRQRRQGICIV